MKSLSTGDKSGTDVPRSRTQKRLALLWSQVFNVHDIGIHDNFLDSGGDSLSATLMLSRIATEFHVELPFDIFFAGDGTLREIAEIIDKARRQQSRKKGLRP
ncbi:MAG: phosphopantetheine-binding protein [Candidatus Acidiferrales bacterium]